MGSHKGVRICTDVVVLGQDLYDFTVAMSCSAVDGRQSNLWWWCKTRMLHGIDIISHN